MIYEIFNPSDTYTIKSSDYMIAATAVMLLGHGMYGIADSPMLFGWDKFFESKGIDIQKFFDEHKTEIADALDSVLIGSVAERELIEEAIEKMGPSEKEKFLAKRHDKMRTSLNDIGKSAKQLASGIRKKQ